MLIRKFPFIKKIHFIILCHFLISNCWGSFILKNDEIIDTHKTMSSGIKNAYDTLPSIFNKFNNLSTASIQFVYQYNDEIRSTEPEPILKNDNNKLITSSSYVEALYDDTHNNPLGILSWPFLGENKFREINTTKTDTKIYSRLFSSKTNTACAEALNLSLDRYNDLLKNSNHKRNPIYYFKSNYNYNSFEDMKHSEPLLVWWIERHLEILTSNFLEELMGKSMYDSKDDIKILYPIIHFHTRRQTCPDCENLIQKSAKKFGYVPIISFSDIYLTEKNNVGFIPCTSSLNGVEKFILPFSTFKNNFLDVDMLEQLKLYKKPRSKRYYFKQRYNINEIEASVDKEFNQNKIEELIRIKEYMKEKKRLKGIKRFPLQFYSSIN